MEVNKLFILLFVVWINGCTNLREPKKTKAFDPNYFYRRSLELNLKYRNEEYVFSEVFSRAVWFSNVKFFPIETLRTFNEFCECASSSTVAYINCKKSLSANENSENSCSHHIFSDVDSIVIKCDMLERNFLDENSQLKILGEEIKSFKTKIKIIDCPSDFFRFMPYSQLQPEVNYFISGY